MVLLLGIFYHPSDATYSAVEIAPVVTTRDVAQQFAIGLPDYAKEVLLSILPIVAVCVLFQLLTHHYRRRQLLRTGVGFLYTVIGLILFLTGVNIGFTPVATCSARVWRTARTAGCSYRSARSSATTSSRRSLPYRCSTSRSRMSPAARCRRA